MDNCLEITVPYESMVKGLEVKSPDTVEHHILKMLMTELSLYVVSTKIFVEPNLYMVFYQ